MSYSIKIADYNDPDVDLSLRKLLSAAYNNEPILPEKFWAGKLNSQASVQSFFLVAEKDNLVVGGIGFLANDFLLNGANYIGFQMCWAATHPDHQGENIFSNLVIEAKKILKEKNAGFLYGIANNRSNPILVNKLGFTEIPSRVLRILTFPFLKQRYFNRDAMLKTDHACMINEEQVKNHKLAQDPSSVKLVSANGSWLWGKLIKKKKFGLLIPVFYVGGIQLNAAKDLEALVDQTCHLHKPLFIQFFSCSNNTLNDLLKGWKEPKKMNGFIFSNLNMPAFDHFNMMIGAIDVF